MRAEMGVDNSLDAGARRIEISLDGEEVIFQDDGAGITAERISTLFSLGNHGPMPTTQLGRFGIGIKGVAVNAGDIFNVTSTSAKGRPTPSRSRDCYAHPPRARPSIRPASVPLDRQLVRVGPGSLLIRWPSSAFLHGDASPIATSWPGINKSRQSIGANSKLSANFLSTGPLLLPAVATKDRWLSRTRPNLWEAGLATSRIAIVPICASDVRILMSEPSQVRHRRAENRLT